MGRSAKAQAPERRRSRSLLHLRRMGADAHTARNALLVRCYTAFRWVRPVQPEQVLESMLAGIPAILKIYSRQFRAVSPPVLSTFAPKRRPRGANRCTASSAVPGRPCRALSGAQPAIPASGDAIRAIPAESSAIWSIHKMPSFRRGSPARLRRVIPATADPICAILARFGGNTPGSCRKSCTRAPINGWQTVDRGWRKLRLAFKFFAP
jgi:hypothetical protein